MVERIEEIGFLFRFDLNQAEFFTEVAEWIIFRIYADKGRTADIYYRLLYLGGSVDKKPSIILNSDSLRNWLNLWQKFWLNFIKNAKLNLIRPGRWLFRFLWTKNGFWNAVLTSRKWWPKFLPSISVLNSVPTPSSGIKIPRTRSAWPKSKEKPTSKTASGWPKLFWFRLGLAGQKLGGRLGNLRHRQSGFAPGQRPSAGYLPGRLGARLLS